MGQPLGHVGGEDKPGHDEDPTTDAEQAGEETGQQADHDDRGDRNSAARSEVSTMGVLSCVIDRGQRTKQAAQ